MSKIRVIMTGPMPPAIGGMATVLNDLKNSKLAEQVKLEFFNTFKTTAEGRNLFIAVKSKFLLWGRWVLLIRGQQQTIVHIHTCSGFTFFLDSVLVCLARMSSRPVVLHIHGGRFLEFLDGLNPLLLGIVRRVFGACQRIVVLSDYWQKSLTDRLGTFAFSVVENGVPIYALQKQDSKEKVQILFLGNLSRMKGVFDLITAMQKIEGAVLNLVGGEDEKGVFLEIEQLINKHQLEDKILIHGPQYGEAKNSFLQVADIFVLPSYAEALPISMLEAMAQGLPVIVSDVGSIPSVITSEQEGFIVEPGQIDELIQAINDLVNDAVLRDKMGIAGRKRCEQQFGIDLTVSKLMKIYSEIT